MKPRIRILAIFLASLSVHCSRPDDKGTDTGNPNIYPTDGGIQAAVLVNSICYKLGECFASTLNCQEEIYNLSSLPNRFGISNPAATMASIRNAEFADEIIADSEASSSCSTEIQALSCLSPQVQGAYSNGSYAGVSAMIPSGVCAQVYP